MALSAKEKRRIEKEEYARRLAEASQVSVPQKHGIPALMSFFVPGLGQIIKGQVGRGILIFFGFLLGLCLLIVPGIIVWAWQISDAYNK